MRPILPTQSQNTVRAAVTAQGSSCARSRMPKAAFTLLELVVSLAVVLLLMSTLIPSLAGARQFAHRTGCLGNLRSWGQATALFGLENHDLLPHDGASNGLSLENAWYTELPPAIGERPYPEQGTWRTNAGLALPRSVWLCPANSRRSDGRMLFHYSLNRLVNGSGVGGHALRQAAVAEPGRTVWLFDNGKKAAVATAGNVHTNLHQGGANILFLDGHASRIPAAAYWDAGRRRAVMDRPELRWTGTDEPGP